MPFSAQFQYQAIDAVTPFLKRLAIEHKKLNGQIKAGAISTAKTQVTAQKTVQAEVIKTKKLMTGKDFKNFGSQINKKFTTPIIAGLTMATIVGGKFEDSLSSLSAITGLSGNALASMKTQIIATSNATGLGASEIAKGMELIGSKQPKLLKTPKLLLDVAKASATMARASGLSFDEAGSSLSDVMNQFSMSGEEALKAVNVLGASAKFGASAIPELSQAIVLAGASANSANISLQETASMVEVLAGKGLAGARAGTQLRNVILKLETASDKNLRPSLVGIDLALENASKSLTDASKATKFFGVENFNASQILIKNRAEVVRMTSAITGTDVAQKQAEIRMKSFNIQIGKMYEQFKNELIPVFDEWRPIILSTLGFLKETVVVLARFIKNNKALVITISAIGVGLSALGSGLAILASLKIAMIAFNVAVATGAGIMTTVFLPVALTIGAILAGFTIGSLIAEIDYVTDKLQQILFSVDDIKLTDDQKSAQEASQARMKAKELNKAGASGGGLNINVNSEISTSQGLSANTSTRVNPTGNLKGQNKGLAR